LKDFDATIARVDYVGPVFFVCADPLGPEELSRLVATMAEPEQQLSISIEGLNPAGGQGKKAALSIEC
jgi:hypothetical protein